jgi:hypothetical protein
MGFTRYICRISLAGLSSEGKSRLIFLQKPQITGDRQWLIWQRADSQPGGKRRVQKSLEKIAYPYRSICSSWRSLRALRLGAKPV